MRTALSSNAEVKSESKQNIVLSSNLKNYLKQLQENKLNEDEKVNLRTHIFSLINDPNYHNKNSFTRIFTDDDRDTIEDILNILNQNVSFQIIINLVLKYLESEENKTPSALIKKNNLIDKLLTKESAIAELGLMTKVNKNKIIAIYVALVKNMLTCLNKPHGSTFVNQAALIELILKHGNNQKSSNLSMLPPPIMSEIGSFFSGLKPSEKKHFNANLAKVKNNRDKLPTGKYLTDLDDLRLRVAKILEYIREQREFFGNANLTLVRDHLTNFLNENLKAAEDPALPAYQAMITVDNFNLCLSIQKTTDMLNEDHYISISNVMSVICQNQDLTVSHNEKIQTFLLRLENMRKLTSEQNQFKEESKQQAQIGRSRQNFKKLKSVKVQEKPTNDILLLINKLKELDDIEDSAADRLKYNLRLIATRYVTQEESRLKISYLQSEYLSEITNDLHAILKLTKEDQLLLKNILTYLSLKNDPKLSKNIAIILDLLESRKMPEVKETKQEIKPIIRQPKPVRNLQEAINKMTAREKIYDCTDPVSLNDNLVFIQKEEKVLLLDPIELSMISRQFSCSAVLIKLGKRIFLYGFNAAREWGITELDIYPFQHLEFTFEPTLLYSSHENARLAMYIEIVAKKAHAFIIKKDICEDAWLQRAKAFISEHGYDTPYSVTQLQHFLHPIIELSSAAEMHNIISALTQKNESTDSANDHLFLKMYSYAKLLCDCPKTYTEYNELFGIKEQPSFAAFKALYQCMEIAKSCLRRNEFILLSLESIGFCLTKKFDDLGYVDISIQESIVETIKSLQNSDMQGYQRFKGLLKYFETPKIENKSSIPEDKKMSTGSVLQRIFPQSIESKTGESSDRKDDLTPNQVRQNLSRDLGIADIKQAGSVEHKADGGPQASQQPIQQEQNSQTESYVMSVFVLGLCLGFVTKNFWEESMQGAGSKAFYAVGLFAAVKLLNTVRNLCKKNDQQNQPNQRKP